MPVILTSQEANKLAKFFEEVDNFIYDSMDEKEQDKLSRKTSKMIEWLEKK